MSVSELTINYVAKPSLDFFWQINAAEFNVSLRKRKAIFSVLMFLLVAFISLYLYLAAEIVTLSFSSENLKEEADYALIASSERESALVKAIYSKNSDFFVAKGYEKPLSIEIIKRSLNVVEIPQIRSLY